jgi:hypothetical protein
LRALAVATPARLACHREVVARTIEACRVGMVEQAAAKGRRLRVPLRGRHQGRQPARLRKRIRVEQRDKVDALAAPDAGIVGGGEAGVVAQSQQFAAGELGDGGRQQYDVFAAVVHQQRAGGRQRLRRQCVQHTFDQVCGVPGHDDDGDRGHSDLRTGCGSAARHGFTPCAQAKAALRAGQGGP